MTATRRRRRRPRVLLLPLDSTRLSLLLRCDMRETERGQELRNLISVACRQEWEVNVREEERHVERALRAALSGARSDVTDSARSRKIHLMRRKERGSIDRSMYWSSKWLKA